MRLAFSTSWIDGDPSRLPPVLPAVDSIEIGTKGDWRFFRELVSVLRASKKPVTSVHASCGPHKKDPEPYYTPHFMSADEKLRRHDLLQVALSARWAEEIGARAVVLHAGSLEDPELRESHALYRESLLREGPGGRLTGLKRDIIRRRSQLMRDVLPHVISGLRSLCLKDKRMLFCIETRVHYYEVPLLEEAVHIVNTLRLPNLGYWHDVGHTFILERLGFGERESWQRSLSDRCIGTHLHDVDGRLTDHLPPGQGTLDFKKILREFDAGSLHTLELNARHSLDEVLRGIEILRDQSGSG